MSAITAKASRKMKKYAVLTREPRCFLGSFDFSWEQRKLGECFSERVESMPDGELISVTINDGIKKFSELGRHDNSNDNKSKYKKVCVGDIAYNSMRMWQGASGYSPYEGIVSPAYTVLSPNAGVFSRCIAYQFKLPQMIHTFQINSQGITSDNWNLKYPTLSEIEIYISKNVAEQKQIAEFFTSLDNLITLHQRKCANLCSPSQVVFSLLFATSTFSWEQRKLGEIGSVSMCRRIFKEQTSETGDIPFYKIGTFGADPDAFISRELFEEYKSKYPYPQKGDILISASGSIGRTVEFAGNNEYFQDSNIVWLNHDERLSNPFLKCFYSVVKWAGIEGSTIKRLYNDNILNTVICMPSVPEQKRIGLFFENLDNLITLHQRECISFTGRADRLILTANKKRTTSSWEQRKVSDLAEKTYGGGTPTTSNEAYWNGDIPWIQSSDVADGKLLGVESRKRITQDGLNNSSAQLIPENSIAIITRVGVGKLAFMPYSYATSQDFLSLSKLNAEPFFTVYACYKKLQSELNAVQGTSIKGITKDELLAKSIMVPQYAEQRQIGAFFKQLDHLITLHQRKPFLMKWRTSDANRNQTNRLVL